MESALDWRKGIDRLAWYVASIAFFVILGVITEDAWDDNELGVITSMEWTLIGGGSIGGAVLVLLAIRGIGWVVSGFLAAGETSPADTDNPRAEIAHSE